MNTKLKRLVKGMTVIWVMSLVWVLITAWNMHDASAEEGRKLEIETVAGLDVEKAVEVLYRADMAIKEEQRQQDIEMLAHLVNAENEGYKARMYTGSVVLNRVESSRYPDSIEGVIWQRGQYACLDDGHYWWEPDELAYKVAEQLIDEGSVIPKDVLMAAEFVQGEIYDKVDGTYYCYGR